MVYWSAFRLGDTFDAGLIPVVVTPFFFPHFFLLLFVCFPKSKWFPAGSLLKCWLPVL